MGYSVTKVGWRREASQSSSKQSASRSPTLGHSLAPGTLAAAAAARARALVERYDAVKFGIFQ